MSVLSNLVNLISSFLHVSYCMRLSEVFDCLHMYKFLAAAKFIIVLVILDVVLISILH